MAGSLDRILDKAIPEPNSGCWLWMGALCNPRYGYGHVTLNGRNETVHRAVWMLSRGPISPGMEIDHGCKNPYCVNIDHLELVTKAENLARRSKTRAICWKGHALTPANTLVRGKDRRCLLCFNVRLTAYKASEFISNDE